MKKYICLVCLFGMLQTPLKADEHTKFMGLPLSLSPAEMIEELTQKGMQQEDGSSLSGRVSGLDVWVDLNKNGDTSALNSMKLTTRYQQGPTLRDDFQQLLQWMRLNYGEPTWQSTVRGHDFARWYLGFDRDIVMIATAKSTVDIWFYDNHKKRNIDYYSILKYCERNPSEGVPNYSARECVTWKSTTAPKVNKSKKYRKYKRKARYRQSYKSRYRAKSKARKRRS